MTAPRQEGLPYRAEPADPTIVKKADLQASHALSYIQLGNVAGNDVGGEVQLWDPANGVFAVIDIYDGTLRVGGLNIGGSGLTVTEVDGSPIVSASTIQFPNASITDLGGGVVRVNAVGATGATGAAGSNGTNGTNGAAGATGATGATGPNAISGSTTSALVGLLYADGSTISAVSSSGTGNVMRVASPTTTGTLTAETIATSGTIYLGGKQVYGTDDALSLGYRWSYNNSDQPIVVISPSGIKFNQLAGANSLTLQPGYNNTDSRIINVGGNIELAPASGLLSIVGAIAASGNITVSGATVMTTITASGKVSVPYSTDDRYVVSAFANYGREFGLYVQAGGNEGGFRADSQLSFRSPSGVIFTNGTYNLEINNPSGTWIFNGQALQLGSNSSQPVTVPGTLTVSSIGTLGIYTVATLPSASSNAYAEANVSDALAPAMGSTVASGGSVKTKVRSNGTNWTVCGI